MRPSVLRAALVALVLPACGTRSAMDELHHLERRWTAALKDGDTAFFRQTLGDDYEYISANGHSLGKADYIRQVESQAASLEWITLDEMNVRIYGGNGHRHRPVPVKKCDSGRPVQRQDSCDRGLRQAPGPLDRGERTGDGRAVIGSNE